jgi:hypothetical protein
MLAYQRVGGQKKSFDILQQLVDMVCDDLFLMFGYIKEKASRQPRLFPRNVVTIQSSPLTCRIPFAGARRGVNWSRSVLQQSSAPSCASIDIGSTVTGNATAVPGIIIQGRH